MRERILCRIIYTSTLHFEHRLLSLRTSFLSFVYGELEQDLEQSRASTQPQASHIPFHECAQYQISRTKTWEDHSNFTLLQLGRARGEFRFHCCKSCYQSPASDPDVIGESLMLSSE